MLDTHTKRRIDTARDGWAKLMRSGPGGHEIEAEQALVNANRELIAHFEKKIQATLARIWGEEAEGDPK